MEKIINPWSDVPGYNCFGCAENNPFGLKMEFYEDGDDIVSYWTPGENYQGWLNVLHGGIQATLLDEICAWVIVRKLQTFGVTSRMEVKYLKSVSTVNNRLTVRARMTERRRNIVTVEASICDASGNVCTTATCIYFCTSEEKAREEMGFKGCRTESE